MFTLPQRFDAIKTFVLVDMKKSRPSELESISGALIQRSHNIGLPVANTKTMYALLKYSLSSKYRNK